MIHPFNSKWLARKVLPWLMVSGEVGLASAQAVRPTNGTVRVAGIVLKWVRADKEMNWRRLEPMVREAAKNGGRRLSDLSLRRQVRPGEE